VWTAKEIEVYEALKKRAEKLKSTMPDYVKAALKRHIENGESAK